MNRIPGVVAAGACLIATAPLRAQSTPAPSAHPVYSEPRGLYAAERRRAPRAEGPHQGRGALINLYHDVVSVEEK